jgi:cysteinyl-tRNA synthetase
VTVRRAGHSTVLPRGTVLPIAELNALARHGPAALPPGAGREMPGAADGIPPAAGGAAATLTEITRVMTSRFDAAAAARDVPAMVNAILDLETAVGDWACDTEEDQGAPQSRAVLRSLISRLGDLAAWRAGDPRLRLAPAVDPLLRLRAVLRGQGQYPAADTIREALAAAGLLVQDTAEGTRWTLPGD